jgi:hypothetical protein
MSSPILGTPTLHRRQSSVGLPQAVQNATALGQLEKDLLIRLVLCTDPHSEASAGLATRVFRSLGLDVNGLPEKEQTIRNKLRARVCSELIPYDEVAELPGKIPGLGPPDDLPVQWALPIPWAGLSIHSRENRARLRVQVQSAAARYASLWRPHVRQRIRPCPGTFRFSQHDS